MDVLIPILSKTENQDTFLDTAAEGAGKIYLMIVVEAKNLEYDFGFTTGQISLGNQLMEDIKKYLTEKGLLVFDVLEWGETIPKITNFYFLKKIKKVVLKKQENDYFKKLVKELKGKKLNVEVI